MPSPARLYSPTFMKMPLTVSVIESDNIRYQSGGITLFGWGTFDGASLVFQTSPSQGGINAPWFDYQVFTENFTMSEPFLGNCFVRWLVRGATNNTQVYGAFVSG